MSSVKTRHVETKRGGRVARNWKSGNIGQNSYPFSEAFKNSYPSNSYPFQKQMINTARGIRFVFCWIPFSREEGADGNGTTGASGAGKMLQSFADFWKLTTSPSLLERENVCPTVQWKKDAGEHDRYGRDRHPARCWVPPGAASPGLDV